ncbi:hypothetical protein RJT34_02181 [Clitoria ternatea]|uniref:Uncharacterized protein n=1 Tax=Clitoria ternatea TaxID=43366 RepID=A0AAN9KK51_CLITE
MRHVTKIQADKNFNASGDNVTTYKNNVILGGDENVTDSKGYHAVDKDVIISCNDDDMEEAKDSLVSGGNDMPTVNNAIVFFGRENNLLHVSSSCSCHFDLTADLVWSGWHYGLDHFPPFK